MAKEMLDERKSGTTEGDDNKKEGGTKESYNLKIEYSCPCGNTVWGKPGLKIICGECEFDFTEKE